MRRPTSSLHRIAAHVDLPEPVVPRMQRWRLSAFSGIKAGHFGIPLRVRSSSPMQMRCGEDTAGRRGRRKRAGRKKEDEEQRRRTRRSRFHGCSFHEQTDEFCAHFVSTKAGLLLVLCAVA